MPFITDDKKAVQNNLELSSIFHQMADCYRYLGNEERFRAIAYENAAKVLHNMKEDISAYATDIKSLDAIGGIGESIAEKIMEYLHTGRIKTFEQLKKKVPFELLELMHSNGLGPATLKTLHEKLSISNRENLIQAIERDKLKTLKGFGDKKIEIIKQSLKLVKAGSRMPLAEAAKIGNEILSAVKEMPGVQKAELAGSLRRKKETVGDIDIVIVAEPKNRKGVVTKFIQLPQVAKVLAKGLTKASVVLKQNDVQVDIRLVHNYEFGAALLYFTGSKEHNVKLRTIAKQRGYKINEYGIFDAVTNKRIAGETEEGMYAFLKLRYIKPEDRLDKGETEKAVVK
ncbi:MAG: type-X family DNA polymerase [Chitinophagaceae bacterium]|nr:type-X family DNA polymerase [Chitinophagaceae bacterium]